jgi:paraquat-inducible protein A
VGRVASTTIIGGAYEMWLQGSEITAVIVAFCAVIAPGGHMLFLLTVMLAVRHPPAPRWVGELLRSAHFMQPWSMTEVMMLGILVALFKIAQLATVIPGIGMYAAGLFVALVAGVLVTFDPRLVWERVEWADGESPRPGDMASGAGGAR